ncbi:hypothetical protein Mal4_42280 [Maioricimonas rarisocia]|uniref:Uncharacterized protein n=1 Tax=Maioricimonas rarisocia TaxID=2528026 RepID=A0A517ZBK0_9PLAN|nr:hypothetical protein [Maioricimonas rarisocia]QDU39875.1 hypothetical protein Mal4_42280 [Maioricimonas rarisocia]
MRLSYRCPKCEQSQHRVAVEPGTVLQCTACDWSRAIPAGDLEGDRPRCCLICGNQDLWRQKDFPQRLGIAAVVAGAALSSIAWYFHQPLLALGILLAFGALDMLLFGIMPDILVCYRCQARHHDSTGDSGHAGFDHELAEKYRQERLRLEQSAGT